MPTDHSDNPDPLDLPALLAIWIRGWAFARALPPPVALVKGAWRVDVNQPGQRVRYVLPGDATTLAAQLARELHAPASWLKVCVARDTLAALLPPHWKMSDQRYFMGLNLGEIASPAVPVVPAGFTLSLTEMGQITRAILRTGSGRQAADGNLILLGRHAVFDQIATETEFRRRGLGRVIMQALANHARTRGAGTGLLVATEAGRQLYLTLDWRELSPYASAFIPD